MAPVQRSFDLHKLTCSTRSRYTSRPDNLNSSRESAFAQLVCDPCSNSPISVKAALSSCGRLWPSRAQDQAKVARPSGRKLPEARMPCSEILAMDGVSRSLEVASPWAVLLRCCGEGLSRPSAAASTAADVRAGWSSLRVAGDRTKLEES